MGEIADMMLEGGLCAGCGSFIDLDGGDGFPRYCSPQCSNDYGIPADDFVEPTHQGRTRPDHRCPDCDKLCRGEMGLKDHRRMKHGVIR